MLALADFGVTVKDARATARWWQEKMGFSTHTVGGEGNHAVMVAPPGERFLLHLCEGFDSVEPGNTGIAFVTDELEAQVQRMEAAGVRFPERTRKESWGGRAMFADPDGNVFWLIGAPADFIRRETQRVAGPATTEGTAPQRKARGG